MVNVNAHFRMHTNNTPLYTYYYAKIVFSLIVDDPALPTSPHGQIMKALGRQFTTSNMSALRRKIEPCCSPTDRSSMQMVIQDEQQIYITQTLPNMIVNSCGCL